jgi:hypothetical protein
MKHKVLAPSLTLILLLTTPPVALMQTVGSETRVRAVTDVHDWQGLRGLKPDSEILIELKPDLRDPFAGKFVSAIGTTLTISQDDFHFSVEQRDIQRVYHLKGKWSRSRTARIGAGIGMVVGTVLGVKRAVDAERPRRCGSDADMTPAFAGFYIGTLAGAGLGALVGGKRKSKLLYEAKEEHK